MIRAALLTLSLVAATSAGHALADPGREVVNIDDGPGHSLVIVRGDGRSYSDQGFVLDYTDATGARVRVYADHPVTRGEVDARLRQAEREGEQARVEGLREAKQARIEAAQARYEAAEARIEAQHAREEALADAY